MRRGKRRNVALGMCLIACVCALPASGAVAAWSGPHTLLPNTGQVQEFRFAAGGNARAVMVYSQGKEDPIIFDVLPGEKKPREIVRPIHAAFGNTGPGSFGAVQQIGVGRDLRVGMSGDGSAIAVWRVGRTFFAAYATAAGTFGPATVITRRGSGDFVFDMGGNGSAALTWWRKTKTGKGALLFVSTRAPGAGFTKPARLARSKKRTADLELDVSDSGGILVLRTGKHAVATLADPGVPFGRPQRIRHSEYTTSGSGVALSSDGSALVLVNGGLKGNGERVRASFRSPGGFFAPARVIGGALRAFGKGVADGPGAFLVEQAMYTRGGRPNGTEVLSIRNGVVTSAVPLFGPRTFGESLAVSGSGAALIGGSDFGGPDTFILGSYRPAGGAFEAPTRLSTGIGCNCLYDPIAEIDEAGNAWIVWGQDDQVLVAYRATA